MLGKPVQSAIVENPRAKLVLVCYNESCQNETVCINPDCLIHCQHKDFLESMDGSRECLTCHAKTESPNANDIPY